MGTHVLFRLSDISTTLCYCLQQRIYPTPLETHNLDQSVLHRRSSIIVVNEAHKIQWPFSVIMHFDLSAGVGCDIHGLL